jgi:RND family efflux transporter MFP subunit
MALVLCGGFNAAAQRGPTLVVVSRAVEREIDVTQTFVGTVMPLKKAIIGSAVDGRVVAYPRNAGDRVKDQEILAQLLTDTIQLEWEAAEAERQLRQQQLAELENGTRREEIDQAQARMIGAEATMRYQQARRARTEAMYANNRAVSEEERDAAVSAAIAAEQAYIEAREAHRLAVAGPRKEQIAQASAAVAVQQATANRLKDLIEKHTIRSRFSGYVTAEHTEVGQWVKQGDPVAEVMALDEVEIVAQVVEQYVPFIRVGMTVPVEVPAIAGRSFIGTVTAIVPQADVQARTFPVQVRVPNELVDEQPLIKAGMYARVTLPSGRKQSAVLVPKDALVLGGPQTVVFVVAPAADGRAGRARPVPVETGAAWNGSIQIHRGLSAGQLVVVQGNERLPPVEQDVQIQRALPPQERAVVEAPPRGAAP